MSMDLGVPQQEAGIVLLPTSANGSPAAPPLQVPRSPCLTPPTLAIPRFQ